MNGIKVSFFWLPKEVIYYVVVPIIVILLIYLIFSIIYRHKKGTYYYNYVVNYVYSTLGIVFCGLLFCLLLGYSIATIQILIINKLIKNYLLICILLAILPIIPSCFLVYVIRIYLKNLKKKEELDNNYLNNKNRDFKDSIKKVSENNNLSSNYEDADLIKKPVK